MGNTCCSENKANQHNNEETQFSYDHEKPQNLSSHSPVKKLRSLSSKQKLELTIEEFRKGIIGRNTIYQGYFGNVLTLYADDTASGRPHQMVESYIQNLLPIYANTHSDNSYFPVVINTIFKKSNEYLLKAFNAPENFILLGAGSGATGAIFHWQEILAKKFSETFSSKTDPPLCFVTEYEHHSNILSWIEWGVEVQPIKETAELDWETGIKDLKSKLLKYSNRSLLLISTSAASNVTSQITPLNEISKLLKNIKKDDPVLGKKIVWSIDLAAYASHKRIDIDELGVDAVFISPHKLTGGPGSSGLLFFNSKLYDMNKPPTNPGGGTVDGVFGYSSKEVIFTDKIVDRETAGTPGILQFIRAALAFQLQDAIGLEYIEKREEELKKKLWENIQKMNNDWKKLGIQTNINVLGTHDFSKRLSIFSIVVSDEKGTNINFKLFHRIFNDVFGIQIRSGCNCAGPFGIEILGIGQEEVLRLAREFKQGNFIEKPGWIRFNVHFSFSDEDLDYFIFALRFTVENARLIEEIYYEKIEDGGYKLKQKNKLKHCMTLHKLCEELDIDILSSLNVQVAEDDERNRLMKERIEYVQKIILKN